MGGSGLIQFELRPVGLEDADVLLEWRNDPLTRLSSRFCAVISDDEHRAWLSAALSDPTRLLLLLVADAKPVASVRFDLVDERQTDAEVSIVVAPPARGRGYSKVALKKAVDRLDETWPEVRSVQAVVHEHNSASRRLFEAAGFELERPDRRRLATLRINFGGSDASTRETGDYPGAESR
ncbi:MAG: GNAT family N-acetyltransferase [Nocardioidaceae bacterium]